jgi:fibronectin type 3 domain-containing protein
VSDVGNTTTATISNLTDGLTYFIAVTAHNSAGLESLPSQEVSFSTTGTIGNLPPAVSLTSPTAGGQFIAPASVAITASATDSDGSISRVEFYSGTTKIGESSASPCGITWSNVPAGLYSITAVAIDNLGASTSSSAISVSVNISLPAVTTGLSATAVSTSQINLSWAAASGASSYTVKRSTTSGGPYTDVTTGLTALSYTNTGLAAGSTYYYVVSAVNAGGESANSAQAVATTLALPPVPAGLAATGGNAQVALSWTASGGASSYNVKRSTTSGGPYTTVATGVTGVSYTNTGLAAGTTYYYVVSALSVGGESANSAQAAATTSTPPPFPTGLAGTPGNAQVVLSWTASNGASSYNVKRSTTSGGPYTTVAAGFTGVSYTDTSVINGTTYFYVVSALTTGGESANSAQAAVTPSLGLPSPWANRDIGAVSVPGFALYNNGTFAIDGSGADIAGKVDEFQYAYQTASGDCTIVARIAAIEKTNAKAKAGIMIRETAGANSRYAAALLTPGSGVQFQRRTNTGGVTTTASVNGITAPLWLKLTRTGNILRAFHSTNGTTWTQFGGNQTVTMSATVTFGLVGCSHADGVLSTSTMDSVTATP